VNSRGSISAYGDFPRPNSAEAKKKLSFEFTESRRDAGRSGAATINPNATYYHFPESSSKQPFYGVDSLSADVLAFFDFNKLDEQRKAPVRYQLTLTDRRSGAVLGVQTYVVDEVNKRACGANIVNTISQAAFIYDAINR
jgi:hypothetical protein